MLFTEQNNNVVTNKLARRYTAVLRSENGHDFPCYLDGAVYVLLCVSERREAGLVL